MSRSAASVRYAPPPGFVLSTSRSPEVEVYAPVSAPEVVRCGACAALVLGASCPVCRSERVLSTGRLERTMHEAQATTALLEWLGATGFPPTLDSVVAEEVPCDGEGRVLGGLPIHRLPVQGEVEPAPTPALERAPVAPEIRIVPVWVARYQANGRSCTTVLAPDGSVHGDRPVNWRRLYISVALSLAPGLIVGLCLGLPTLVFFGFGLLVWAVALVLLVLGHRRWAKLERIALEALR